MTTSKTTYDTIVIGGGQAGLVTGYELSKRGIDFVIFDASARTGDVWRNRWDSLRLFTPARMSGLAGMPFTGKGTRFIGKDEIADYLEAYASEMDLPVRNGVKVERVSKDGSQYEVQTSEGTYRCANVVVAMADYQVPHIPDFAPDLDPGIVQLHSKHYRNPSQLADGPTLVVGMGNSGADIAYEAAQHHPTYISGSPSGAIPFRLEGWFGRHLGTRLVKTAMINILNTSTPIGRKVRPKMLTKPAPLVRVRPKELKAAGVERVERIAGVRDGKPVDEAGRVLDVANVVWCTGFKPGFTWVDLPVFDEERKPLHDRGVVESSPGLYFVGLFFLHAVWSETLVGVSRDAAYVVNHLANQRTPERV